MEGARRAWYPQIGAPNRLDLLWSICELKKPLGRLNCPLVWCSITPAICQLNEQFLSARHYSRRHASLTHGILDSSKGHKQPAKNRDKILYGVSDSHEEKQAFYWESDWGCCCFAEGGQGECFEKVTFEQIQVESEPAAKQQWQRARSPAWVWQGLRRMGLRRSWHQITLCLVGHAERLRHWHGVRHIVINRITNSDYLFIHSGQM